MQRETIIVMRARAALGGDQNAGGGGGWNTDTLYDLLDRLAAQVDGGPLTPRGPGGAAGGAIVTLPPGEYTVTMKAGDAGVDGKPGAPGFVSFEPVDGDA